MKEAAGMASSGSNGESSGNQIESEANGSSYEKDDGFNMLDRVAV